MNVVLLLLSACLTVAVGQIGANFSSTTVQHSAISTTTCTSVQSCPTWFTCNPQNNNCECGIKSEDGAIVCDNDKLISAVRICYCVTYDVHTNSTFVGPCFYNCKFHSKSTERNRNVVYQKLPRKPTMLLNDSACTYFHRTGLLCGECEEGYSPLVLSYNLSCVECKDGHKNWWKFIIAGFLPLTVFYFFVVFFSINVTSSRLHGVVWFSQIISSSIFVRIVFVGLSHEKSWWQLKVVRAFCVFYSLWNLDLFHSVYPDICLNISTLQALALEYLFAFYPYILILISYIIIVMYDRNYKLVVVAWRPFKKVLDTFRISWDIRTSVIDSFATFFLLSYIKILSVSSDILTPTEIYELGKNESMLRLYYSPVVVYFGEDHRPYAILALVIIAVFVIMPTTIIILYPHRFFQKLLSLLPFNWHFLHAYVDSFQGCYKDGTKPGTYDCRWFIALMLLHRILLFILYGLTLTVMYYIYATITIVLLLIAIVNIEPFKTVAINYHSTDSIFFFLLGICYISIVGRQIPVINTRANSSYHSVLVIQAILSGLLPILYTLYLVASWMISRRRSTV